LIIQPIDYPTKKRKVHLHIHCVLIKLEEHQFYQ